MDIGITTTLRADFDETVAAVRVALSGQGFGILTEIDMQATLKAKIDADIERYLILGACNPTLAHEAVSTNKQLGLLLPCNVVVRSSVDEPGEVIVEAMNPQLMVQVAGDDALQAVADAAGTKLRAAIAALTA